MDVIFNGIYGSNLYGLATPTSDVDYKGVYAPKKRDIVFNEYQDSIEKQTKEVDETFYAVTKFIKILSKNDMVSTDMLFTPVNMTLQSSPLWNQLQSHRQDIICKNMKGLVGYIKTQASKYGHKVQRYNEMTEFLQMIKDSWYCNQLIKNTTLPELINRSGFKYISFVPKHSNFEEHIDICGSKYQTNAQVHYIEKCLEQKLSKYGTRTKTSSMKNGDWKSLSHSVRLLYQMDELIETRDLIFPLVKAPDIMKVKLGQQSLEEVADMIEGMFEDVMDKLHKSDLPEYNNMENLRNAVLNYYGI